MSTYSCDEARRAIPWFLDDELDAVQSLELEGHITDCVMCRAVLERESHLRLTVRRASRAVHAPASLRQNVRRMMSQERTRQGFGHRVWPAAMAAAALLAFVWRGPSNDPYPELAEAASYHARNIPMDVTARDVHAVKQYFSQKLPFAVELPEIEHSRESRAELLWGGRVANVGERDAAYVRYETPQGRLSIFVYEDPYGEVAGAEPLYRLGETPGTISPGSWTQRGQVSLARSGLLRGDGFARAPARRGLPPRRHPPLIGDGYLFPFWEKG